MTGQRKPSLAASFAFIAPVLLLAGCDTLEPAAPPTPQPAPPPALQAIAPPAPPPAEPAPPLPKPKPADLAALHAAPKSVPMAPPEPLPEPEPMPPVKLVGLDEAETLALLGRPYNEREVAPAKVWDYAASGCRLEVFFYLDVASNSFHVLQYRVAGDTSGGEASQRCLKRVVDERHG